MDNLINEENPHDRNVRKNNYKVFVWTLAWLVTQAIPKKGIFLDWFSSSTLSIIAIFLHLIACVGLFFILKRYVAELDEMWRRAYINAAAFAALIVWLVGNLYSMVKMSSFMPPLEIVDTTSLINITVTITFMSSLIIGVKYR